MASTRKPPSRRHLAAMVVSLATLLGVASIAMQPEQASADSPPSPPQSFTARSTPTPTPTGPACDVCEAGQSNHR